MAQIQALRGLHYDLARVGDLSDVVAPPYDVIDTDLQNKLYDKHPNNVVRLILNRAEPNDGEQSCYTRASEFLQAWRKSGVLAVDKTPAIYVYHQAFEHAGRRIVRRGFMSRVWIEPFGTGCIFPHEETHAKVKEDRLRLTRATHTNLSQIFSVYPDEDSAIQNLLEQSLEDPTPITAIDHLGVVHRMWRVTDEPTIARVASMMADKSIYVADGHHRYETAANYREEVLGHNGDPNHPANFVLMMCVATGDDGLIVLPTHRLFRGAPELASDQLTDRLGSSFEYERIGQGPQLASEAWSQIQEYQQQSSLALYTHKDQSWILAHLTDSGRDLLSSIVPNRSIDWRSLGVSILHELIVKHLLGLNNLPTPRYVHSVEEVVTYLCSGDSAGRDATGQTGSNSPFNFAALIRPAGIGEIQAVSAHNERMPAKSTYFYPKLLSGLIFNPLDA